MQVNSARIQIVTKLNERATPRHYATSHVMMQQLIAYNAFELKTGAQNREKQLAKFQASEPTGPIGVYRYSYTYLFPSAMSSMRYASASAGRRTTAISSFSFLAISFSSTSICFLLSTTSISISSLRIFCFSLAPCNSYANSASAFYTGTHQQMPATRQQQMPATRQQMPATRHQQITSQ